MCASVCPPSPHARSTLHLFRVFVVHVVCGELEAEARRGAHVEQAVPDAYVGTTGVCDGIHAEQVGGSDAAYDATVPHGAWQA